MSDKYLPQVDILRDDNGLYRWELRWRAGSPRARVEAASVRSWQRWETAFLSVRRTFGAVDLLGDGWWIAVGDYGHALLRQGWLVAYDDPARKVAFVQVNHTYPEDRP